MQIADARDSGSRRGYQTYPTREPYLEHPEGHGSLSTRYRSSKLQCTVGARNLLLENSTRLEYGARELKRTVQRNFIQPVSALVAEDQIPAGSTVILDAKGNDFRILLRQ